MAGKDRKLRLNGAWAETDAVNVRALLESLEIPPAQSGTAVAINEAIVPRSKWEETVLKDGDNVEIIRAVAGG